MKRTTVIVLSFSGFLFAGAQIPALAQTPSAPPPAAVPAAAPSAQPAPAAPASRFVGIREVRCARLFELSNEDRAAAAMFYIGYEASRAGAGAINIGGLRTLESMALSYCAAFPDRPAYEGFAQAYALTGW